MATTERFAFLRSRGEGDAWHAVQLARHQDRPYTLDYLARICDDFLELHGDRAEADDAAVVAGIGSFRGQTVAFVGHQKGRDLKQRTHRNFGMPSPEGYRKAMRVFAIAARLRFPVVTLIDTPGAAPGVGAEQRGQSGAIARSQLTLMGLRVPVVACVIGEGSSGGALAFGIADRVLMQQNAIYTVISPEGARRSSGRTPARRGGRRPRCAHRRSLPGPRRRRRDRAGAVGRRPQGPREGGRAPGRCDPGRARRPELDPGAAAAGRPAGQVPRHGRLRGVAEPRPVGSPPVNRGLNRFEQASVAAAAILTVVAGGVDLAGAPNTAIFVLSGLALVSLAWIVGVATEQLAESSGPKVGGVLNATFGNAAELIITIFAIRAGQLEVATASITGSILGQHAARPGRVVPRRRPQERDPDVRPAHRGHERLDAGARGDRSRASDGLRRGAGHRCRTRRRSPTSRPSSCSASTF